MTNQFEVVEVDTERAKAVLAFMLDYVSTHSEEITKAEDAAKDALMGLILTTIASGLVRRNDYPKITQLRNKILVAFEIGYYHGKMNSGIKSGG